jgi:CheY-like chemotaxis protein
MKGAKQILVVEDHEDTRNVLERLCSRCGLVFTAATLHEALQLAQTTPFDVIISDIALPDGTGLRLNQRSTATRHKRAVDCLVGLSLSGRCAGGKADRLRLPHAQTV